MSKNTEKNIKAGAMDQFASIDENELAAAAGGYSSRVSRGLGRVGRGIKAGWLWAFGNS